MRKTSFRERLDVYFKLLICSISWFRYIDIYSDDVIIVEVTMTRQKFQKIAKMDLFGDILRISDY